MQHVKDNASIYFSMLLAFIVGISAGAFTVNGLSSAQRDELVNYFKGFLQLFTYQKLDSSELFKVALLENLKIVAILWALGVTIIGIPFIYVIIGIRGFITGFSSGFIIETIGARGLLFTVCALIPKEIIVIPCIIALGAYGINFSLRIIKSKSVKHFTKQSLKSSFFAYCLVTVFFTSVIFAGILVEAYVTPVFIRMITPLMGM
jgi:stage II sporulation protein M